MEPKCVSYNMEDISGSPSITKCELNNSTHNDDPDDFKPWSNYIYRGSEVSVGYEQNKKAKSVYCRATVYKNRFFCFYQVLSFLF